MNILDMIKNEKVEWKKLGEVCEILKGKQFNKKNMLENGSYPVINGGILPSGYVEVFNQLENTITISQGGASAGYVNFIKTKFWLGAHAFSVIPKEKVLNKYIFYLLKENKSKLQDKKEGAGIPSVSKNIIFSLEIPIPSLETQEKIVKTLDKFTEYVTELQVELHSREKQYEFYRELLLSKEHLEKNIFETFEVKLGEVVTYPKEKISYESLNENNYVSVENLLKNKEGKSISMNIPNNSMWNKFISKDILIGNIRPYLRKIWYADSEGGTNGDVIVFRINEKFQDKINSKYLFHTLSSELFFEYMIKYSKGTKMPRGDKNKILEYKFYIPNLEIQEKIVYVLDNFEKVCKDLNIGLPKEIELRQKQYEYFREKLLNFNKNLEEK